METLQTTQTTQTNPPSKLLLDIDDVKALTGFSTTTIYKHMKTGDFPKPKKCGSRAVRWRLADIQAYINA